MPSFCICNTTGLTHLSQAQLHPCYQGPLWNYSSSKILTSPYPWNREGRKKRTLQAWHRRILGLTGRIHLFKIRHTYFTIFLSWLIFIFSPFLALWPLGVVFWWFGVFFSFLNFLFPIFWVNFLMSFAQSVHAHQKRHLRDTNDPHIYAEKHSYSRILKCWCC